jgi:hypothetical protein
MINYNAIFYADFFQKFKPKVATGVAALLRRENAEEANGLNNKRMKFFQNIFSHLVTPEFGHRAYTGRPGRRQRSHQWFVGDGPAGRSPATPEW